MPHIAAKLLGGGWGRRFRLPADSFTPSEESRAAPSLVIVTQLYPPGAGGAEMHSQRLGLCLTRRGHRVAVLTLCPASGQPGRWTEDPFGLPLRLVRRLPSGTSQDLFFAAATLWLLLTELRRYHCVHWTMTGLHTTLGLPVAHWLGIRNVVMFAGSTEIAALPGATLGPILIWIMRRWANRIVVLNPQMVEEIEQLGLPSSRAVMFPCEVDAEQYAAPCPALKASIRHKLGFSPEDLIVLSVARFVPEKGLPALIEAFAAVRREVEGALLALVGDGPLMPAVLRQIQALGLGASVRLPGFLASALVKDYLQAADVFALASGSEGIPCALIEALATGLPAVVTAIPGLTQVVEDGVQGLWASPGDPASIAARLSSLLRDAPRRAQMGRRARELAVAKYAMDVMASKYDAFFRELREEPA